MGRTTDIFDLGRLNLHSGEGRRLQLEVMLDRLKLGGQDYEIDGRRVPVRIFDERREIAPRSPSFTGAHHGEHVHGEIRAPMQGTILRVLVEPGQRVEPGDVVCVLEAMKMENSIVSPREGEVSELPVEPGQVVQTGQTLAVID